MENDINNGHDDNDNDDKDGMMIMMIIDAILTHLKRKNIHSTTNHALNEIIHPTCFIEIDVFDM
jgi:hypothetical protein